jgi:uncharacterized protein YqfB (UPF0267 family)
MDESRLKELYSNLLNNVDFDKLDLGLKNPNIFTILRITRNEIRHSNFLSWLLNPKGSHGLDDLFLKRFLREVFSSEKFGDIDQVDVEGLNLNEVQVLREWNHIDLLVVLSDVVICIENKVITQDHSEQLERYKEVIQHSYPNKRKVFVYLNPDGDESNEEIDTYQPLSYEFIVDVLDRIIEVYGDSIKPQVLVYIKDYITVVKQDIMGTDKLVELSQKIYSNHKEIIDFILENRPDLTRYVGGIITTLMRDLGYNIGSENKYYVRFLNPEVEPYIYRNTSTKNGWKQGESFLHEIVIQVNKGRIIYKPVLSPSDSTYNSDGLLELLLRIEGFRKPSGKKWRVPFSKDVKFNFDEFETLTEEEKSEELKKVLSKFLPIVQKVDRVLLENQHLLKEWKEC